MAIMIGMSSCASSAKIVKDEYYQKNREDIIVQKYLAQVTPETSNLFIMPLSASGDDISERERTDIMVQAFIDKMQAEAIRDGGTVAEFNVNDILTGTGVLSDLLRGIVDFGIDFVTEERVPQPLNVFRQAKFGREIYRKEKDHRDKY